MKLCYDEFMAKQKKLLLMTSLSFFSVTAFAVQGYVTDKDGHIWKDYAHECWENKEWSPNSEVDGCGANKAALKAAAAPAQEVEQKTTEAKAVPLYVSGKDLSDKAHFARGKASLTESDKSELSKVAQEIKGMDKKVVVKGYTDKTGNEKLNQKLSYLRAEQTKNYLISKGVAADLIEVEGKGSSDSVTGTSCNGKTGAELSNCLQQDRRVEIYLK